ncbi:MAG: ABC transporter ATP-binding protein [bacterium]
MNVIETRALTKIYRRGLRRPPIRAADALDIAVVRGEIFGFLGPNGAGKTTTIKILMGLTSPTSGEAFILGEPLGNVAARRRIGFLPENPSLHAFLTGRQAIEFYAGLHGIAKKHARSRIADLARTLRLRDELALPLSRQSRGMVQKIGLAQAMVNDPELLILDEPMSGLDPIGRRDLRAAMLELKERGRTIFFSSHIMADVEMVCDRAGMLIGGKLTRVVDLGEHRAKSDMSLEDLFIEEIRAHHAEGGKP